MPSPTPVRITPLATPRREAGTWAITLEGARIIRAPPTMPDSSRQTKNQANGILTQHAAKDTAASSMAPRSTLRMPNHCPKRRAATAPPR